MNQIRPWLYIGKYRETKNLALLRFHGIGAMLQLAELIEQPDIQTLYLSVDDGIALPNSMIVRGLEFIQERQEAGEKVLIACGAGVSRATSFAIAMLKETEGLGLLEAYRDVKQHHPETMPHPALWNSLCQYYGEEIAYLELMRQL